MRKQDLLNYLNDDLLEKIFGFCYARTNDSYDAEELCSDIIHALVKSACTDGEIEHVYPFVWRVARNVYADFINKHKKQTEAFYEGKPEELLLKLSQEDLSDNTLELLDAVHRRIAFLTRAYREAMIMFYLDGLSTAQIAKEQGTSEVAVRQRLFSARQKIKSELEEMAETYSKPVALDKINYVIWGTGSPAWGDPRLMGTRVFSKHVIWLCRKKPMSAVEIAQELNVPTVYVEDELEVLRKGRNGEYGFLRRLENGKYVINFILFEKEVFEKATSIYTERLPQICNIISNHIQQHKAEYLAFPYLNKQATMNLILWQQILTMSDAFSKCVERILEEKYFPDVAQPDRPYSIFGYVDHGKYYGNGWDYFTAQNICGFSKIRADNIYGTRVKPHFRSWHNISADPLLQLALRAIEGLDITSLSEREKEHAAKAIECEYLYRCENTLYTKILVSAASDQDRLFKISNDLQSGYFEAEAKIVAQKLAALIKKVVPDHLLGEWRLANKLANGSIFDAVVDHLIEQGILTLPKDGIGAEGCWMSVKK